MNTVLKVMGYGLQNQLRSRWLPGYCALFLVLTDALFRFGGDGPRVVVSLMNVVLLLIPLVGAVLGTLYVSGSREFIELLLAQPVGRPALFTGLYLGLALPLAGAFVLGVSVPVLLHGGAPGATLAVLLGAGVLLTFVFTSLAFVAGVRADDRARALGVALVTWFAAAVLYDGLLLLLAAAFRDYPLEGALLVATLANPVDLARVLLLLTFDVAALMGYTGAVFKQFLGSALGMAVAATALLAWTVVPFVAGLRAFQRKDF